LVATENLQVRKTLLNSMFQLGVLALASWAGISWLSLEGWEKMMYRQIDACFSSSIFLPYLWSWHYDAILWVSKALSL